MSIESPSPSMAPRTSGATSSPETSSASPSARQSMKQALQGRSFDVQMSALAPRPPSAAVQRKDEASGAGAKPHRIEDPGGGTDTAQKPGDAELAPIRGEVTAIIQASALDAMPMMRVANIDRTTRLVQRYTAIVTRNPAFRDQALEARMRIVIDHYRMFQATVETGPERLDQFAWHDAVVRLANACDAAAWYRGG